MSDYPERTIERLRARCEDREDMSAADADAILQVSDEMDLLGNAKYSINSRETILMRMVKLATEVGGVADAIEDEQAARDIVRWINREYDNAETNKRYRTVLRTFGDLATDGDDVPDALEWVPTGYPETHDPMPDPAKMYHWEHAKALIDACQNTRDEALIALAWDLGPRTSEFFDLDVANISDSKFGKKATIENGKNGSRSPTIIRSVPFVQDWLNRHPGGPDDPLWTHLNNPKKISKNYLRNILTEAASRTDADLPSRPTPTRMRKSSASYLASQGVSQPHLEEHHGWKRGSKQAARYIAVFGDANDRAIAGAHGIDVPDDDDGNTMRECVRCGMLNEPEAGVCRRCGHALTPKAAEMEEKRAKNAQFTIAQLDGDDAMKFIEFLNHFDDPEAAASAFRELN